MGKYRFCQIIVLFGDSIYANPILYCSKLHVISTVATRTKIQLNVVNWKPTRRVV